MDKEQIIQMARDAGFGNYAYEAAEIFERFAAAIRAATKEEDARICESEPERQRGDGVWSCDQKACAEAIRASK